MAEQLFRFCVIRPPVSPDSLYPPVGLGQDSEFQKRLKQGVTDNRDDPRKGLSKVASDYLASDQFVSLALNDVNNAKLDKAATAVDALINSTQPCGHADVVSLLQPLLGDPSNQTWFDDLSKRLKDSIIALRILSTEDAPGNLSALGTRLRTIEVARKLTDDNFPLNRYDLKTFFNRPLLAPTFADLKSVLSTAKARADAAKEAEEDGKAAQTRIEDLFAKRLRVAAARQEIVALPTTVRQTVPATEFTPTPPKVDLTRLTLAQDHLNLVKNLSSLTLSSFEEGVKRQGSLPEGAASRGAVADSLSATTALSAVVAPLVNMSQTLFSSLSTLPAQPRLTPALKPSSVTPYALQPSALELLSEATNAVLKELSISVTARPVDHTIGYLNQQLAANARALDMEYEPYRSSVGKVQDIGGLKLHYQLPFSSEWLEAVWKGLKYAPPIILPINLLPRPAGRVSIIGVADLLVVKQQLITYEGGDVAYIENVLKGETRSREVGTLTSTEVLTTTETAQEETTQTDTTTAERFEVTNESDKVIKEDQSVKAGVTVSASYGPSVSISANASYANDRSNSEATRAASKYARDITTKATDKILKRTLQRTETRTRTETTTKDVHALINSGPAHTSGVYQWLNKVYQAQVWNYGKRTIVDFLLPEPGAFYLDKQTDPKAANTLVVVPPFKDKPESLSIENYARVAAQYGVTDLDPPPGEVSRATAAYAAGKDEPHAKADKIAVPAGFQVSGISVTASGVSQIDKDQNWVMVTCGKFQWGWDPSKEVIGYIVTTTDYVLWTDKNTSSIIGQGSLSGVKEASAGDIAKEQVEIPWSVTAAYMDTFAVTIELFLERTEEALTVWRNKIWAKIRAAADKLVADQNAAIEKARYNSTFGSSFQGRNPEKNKEIMRDEIKKNCISILTDSHFDDMGATRISRTRAQPGSLCISEIDLDRAELEGPYVRFFEQAFEWEEATWTLYPYFWGRKDHWYRRVDYEDEDPEFERFVQAGYARTNVPIRPGFEGALEHYLATGAVWNGGQLPGISSSLFLPLATELQEDLGRKALAPTPYGEPWTVQVPTNLVKLRSDDKSPVWKKNGEGDWVEVVPV